MSNWVKIGIISVGTLLVAGATYLYIKKSKAVNYDDRLTKLFGKINQLPQAERNAKMQGGELSQAELTNAISLMAAWAKSKDKMSEAEKEQLYRYLNRVFGN